VAVGLPRAIAVGYKLGENNAPCQGDSGQQRAAIPLPATVNQHAATNASVRTGTGGFFCRWSREGPAGPAGACKGQTGRYTRRSV